MKTEEDIPLELRLKIQKKPIAICRETTLEFYKFLQGIKDGLENKMLPEYKASDDFYGALRTKHTIWGLEHIMNEYKRHFGIRAKKNVTKPHENMTT